MKKLFPIFALAAIVIAACNKEKDQPSTPVHVTSISLNKKSLSMKVGETFTLVQNILPVNAKDKSVCWKSDNETAVIVSSEGIVKAVNTGSATVTATTSDQGLTATCSVEVTDETGVVTGEATHISCRNAKISGQVNVSSPKTLGLSFGVLYSTSSGVIIGSATQIVAKKYDQDYNFVVETEVLEPETTYYYRSYIIQDREIAYGELKSFKTLAVSSMIQTADATDINVGDAVLNANLDLTDCEYYNIEYGFEVTPEGGEMHTVKSTNRSQNKFSAKDESLSSDTQYSFVAYVKLDGRTYKADAKSFKTASIQASVTAESSNEKCKVATISGKLTVTSAGTFTKSADLYHSGTATTVEELKASGNRQSISLNSDGTYSVVTNGLVADAKNYYCVIATVDNKEFATSVNNLTTLSLPDGAVDLGLSVAWHQCNVGASKSEEYGRYFAWGDTVGQTWDGSQWSGGGFSTCPSFEVDANNNLKPEYDAAHVFLGETWRMPTCGELQELANGCTREWTDDFNGTKVAGTIFTGKKEGFTDRSIFLPAVGYGLYSSLYATGSQGSFWSASFSDGSRAMCLYMYTSSISTGVDYCYYGNAVRPVSE